MMLVAIAICALVVTACGGSDAGGGGADAAAARPMAPIAVQPVSPLPTGQPQGVVYVTAWARPGSTEPSATATPRPAPTDAAPAVAAQSLPATASAGRAATRTPRPPASSRAAVPTKSPAPKAAKPTRTRRPTPTPRPPAPTKTPSNTPPPTAPPAPTEDTSLLAALRRGGHVIYLRHAKTDWTQSPREEEWVEEVKLDPSLFSQCDRQRLLTDEGRDQARAIGDAFRRLGIPVGQVLSSAWCRTRDTADLAFGGAEVAGDRLWDTGYLNPGSPERNQYRDALRGLLSDPPGGGANRVIVGHMPQLQDAAGISLSEGEAAVVWPEGDGFKVRQRVPFNGWDRLGEN